MGALNLFTNADDKTVEASAVKAPAFSLTKTMAAITPLVVALVTFLADRLDKVDFKAVHVAALLVALVAFLAITGAADVIARGIAASAEIGAKGGTRVLRFDPPLVGKVPKSTPAPNVYVIAASDATPPEFLCLAQDGAKVSWEKADKVSFG